MELYTERGFSLVELMIYLALTGLVLVGAYRVQLSFSRNTTAGIKSAHRAGDIAKFEARFSDEIDNAALIQGGTDSILQGLSPLSYFSGSNSMVCGASPTTPTNSAIATSILPLPQRSFPDDATEINGMDPVDPSEDLGTSHKSDAVRFVTLVKESAPVLLAIDPASPMKATYDTRGTNTIVLQSQGDLALGDFAVIVGSHSSGLFRITDIRTTGRGIELEHSTSLSVWNANTFDTHYGADGFHAFVHKVKVMDYVHDDSTQEIKFDDHMMDDGYNFSNRSLHAKVRIPNWQTIAKGVEYLKITYVISKCDNVSNSPTAGQMLAVETRNPQLGLPSDKTPLGQSQISYPGLRRILLEIKQTSASEEERSVRNAVSVRTLTASNLTNAPYGEGEGFTGPPLAIHATDPLQPGGTENYDYGSVSSSGPPACWNGSVCKDSKGKPNPTLSIAEGGS